MIQGLPSQTGQLRDVLDYAPIAVFVCALKNGKLLYANQAARALLPSREGLEAYTCYQMAGFDRPCPFCQAEKMNRTELLVREFVHPQSRRIFQLSGKLIDWVGEPAHIEYIVDITEIRHKDERAKALREELEATLGNIPCGLSVYRFDADRITPLYHNPAFYEIMGYSREHIRAVEKETDYLGVHPQDLQALQDKIADAILKCGELLHIYRVWNDEKAQYRWIRLDGAVKAQEDGAKLLYGIYSDVSEQKRLEKELMSANEKMQDVVNAIPGGVAIYRVSDIFETVYFSDGVPELSGYTVSEYRELARRDAVEMTYWEDTAMVIAKAREVIDTRGTAQIEFRKQHRDGHIVWVRAQIRWMGEENGYPLLHCVFHNISDFKEAQLEMSHLVNSIPGGIASYRVEGGRFYPTFFSDGVLALSGYTREEYEALLRCDAFGVIYEPDKPRVHTAAREAVASGGVLDIYFRMRHKEGNLIWVHVNGRRMGPLAQTMRFYAVFTGMSAETRLFQSIANETADGIYVIDRENYDLLYVNESKELFVKDRDCLARKCYAALHGQDAPCAFCTLKSHLPDGQDHEMVMPEEGRFYSTRFRETDWNGIPAYVKYVRDITDEIKTRREKERLEQYFQSVVKNLPGGIAVIRNEGDGRMAPEYLSDGFAEMTGMRPEEAWRVYRQDILAGVHAQDREAVKAQMDAFIVGGASREEFVYRLKKGVDGYVWVKNTVSLIQSEGAQSRFYAVYQDITKERLEQERVRRQYQELILKHYRTPGPDALLVGHCNLTQGKLFDVVDYTHANLIELFGVDRMRFYNGLAGFVSDLAERKAFLETFENTSLLVAFADGCMKRQLKCFIHLPGETTGRYVRFVMHMVATPDSDDVTGILTVTDVTEKAITDQILHRLSVTGYDMVADVDMIRDRYTVLSSGENAYWLPPQQGRHSEWVTHMLQTRIVPRDQARYEAALCLEGMRRRLQQEGSYTFSFSMMDEQGDICTKNMTVTAIDLRLGRACLSRTDITESFYEQQGLLRMIAYTFELAGFIELSTERLTLYTREMVIKNLPPYIVERYDERVPRFVEQFGTRLDKEQICDQFRLASLRGHLTQKPSGYDFLFSCMEEEDERFKQVNVLWGDVNHKTICLVRADVTDMLAAERKVQQALKDALASAEEANRAKSDFLSAMSHDIRTPMNAIMGMTSLAAAHLDDRARIADCLGKIAISSKHLLSLINDILDMSKIEQSKITLNRVSISLAGLLDQLSAMLGPQARSAGLHFAIRTGDIRHPQFYGDALRINQILINILSNAIKFTPTPGEVELLAEEREPVQGPRYVRYRFKVRDTGIGMEPSFLSQIFEPFTRGGGATRVEGTGLGLSITKGLVDRMGGEISVESRPHKGTTFCVELEFEWCAKQMQEEETPVFSMLQDGDRAFVDCRFLIAEDNEINAEILSELLRIEGADAAVVSDGAQAVEAFAKAQPGTYDAILMDIQMPVMNGYEATRAIRRLHRADAREIPILAMTANAFSEDVQAAMEAGMNAHLAKPVDVNVLRAELRRALEARAVCARTNRVDGDGRA